MINCLRRERTTKGGGGCVALEQFASVASVYRIFLPSAEGLTEGKTEGAQQVDPTHEVR